MGKLVTQAIPALFGGVSKQPAIVRTPSQVASSDNALPSVVTGGFEKRPATQYIAELDVDTSVDYRVHAIDRDSTEQYMVLVAGGLLYVFDAITGVAKTVEYADTPWWVAVSQSAASTGVKSHTGLDTTKVRLYPATGETTVTWNFNQSGGTTARFKIEGSADGTTWNDIATSKGGATSGTFDTTIDAVATGDHNYIRVNVTTLDADENFSVRVTLKTTQYLQGVAEDFQFVSVADYTFITNRNAIPEKSPKEGLTLEGTVQDFSTLAAASGTEDDVFRVEGNDGDGFSSYYVRSDGTVYEEYRDPTVAHGFNAAHMPHTLVREADGDFTFGPGAWEERLVGDDVTAEFPPDLIGNPINDVSFFRGRLALMVGEHVILSNSLNVFNLWPDSVTQVVDTDPIYRQATAARVSVLKTSAVFRKLMFVSSDSAQFEVSGADASLTPSSAALEMSTTYHASDTVKPEGMGDVLYFASSTPSSTVIYEYFFNEVQLSNTAGDVTKHIVDYIPTEVFQLAADPTANTMALLTTGESNALYLYRTYFDGANKIQSAWSRYLFGESEATAFIHGVAMLSGFIVVVIQRADGNVYLEQIPIEREGIDTALGYAPLLDQRTLLSGVYDVGDNTTTWTTPWEHADDAVAIMGGASPYVSPQAVAIGVTNDYVVPGYIAGASDTGRVMDVIYPSSTTLVAAGDFSGTIAYVGRPYEMAVELSRIFLRDDSGGVLNGRLQLRDIALRYQNTGYFYVDVEPHARATNTYEFTGRILGSSQNIIGFQPIEEEGTFKVPVFTNADTVTITVKNDQHVPSVISAAEWRGFFNELSRQG